MVTVFNRIMDRLILISKKKYTFESRHEVRVNLILTLTPCPSPDPDPHPHPDPDPHPHPHPNPNPNQVALAHAISPSRSAKIVKGPELKGSLW